MRKPSAVKLNALQNGLMQAFDGSCDWLHELVEGAGYIRKQMEAFKPVHEVAKEIGCTDKVIRNHCIKGSIPFRKGGRGKYLVQPWVTYRYLNNQSKPPKNLQEPSSPAQEEETNQEPKTLTTRDPMELLMEIISTIDLNKANATEKKLIKDISDAIIRIEQNKEKSKQKVERSDVIEMLLSLGKIYTSNCDISRSDRAKELFHFIQEQFDVKIRHAGALSMITRKLSEHDQNIALAVKETIKTHKGKLQ